MTTITVHNRKPVDVLNRLNTAMKDTYLAPRRTANHPIVFVPVGLRGDRYEVSFSLFVTHEEMLEALG